MIARTALPIMILAGALVGGGLFLLIAFLLGVNVLPARRQDHGRLLRAASRRLVAAGIVALLVLLVTRWVVLTAAAAALVLVWPTKRLHSQTQRLSGGWG